MRNPIHILSPIGTFGPDIQDETCVRLPVRGADLGNPNSLIRLNLLINPALVTELRDLRRALLPDLAASPRKKLILIDFDV